MNSIIIIVPIMPKAEVHLYSKLEIFIEEVCMITIRAYRKEKIVVSGDVFEKARQKSGLSEEHGQQLLSLVADCL